MPNIRDYYATRNGTLNGIPVEHLSANIMPQDWIQPQCDEFVGEFSLTLVANDYNPDPSRGARQTNAVHDLFADPFIKPVFAIINCVSNSPSHNQYQLLVKQIGAPGDGSITAWQSAFNLWRFMIDGVQAPRPKLTNLGVTNGAVRFTFSGQRGRTNQVLCSSNLVDWTILASYTGTNAPITFRDTNALSNPHRFYKIRRL